MKEIKESKKGRSGNFIFKDGKLYFSKELERKVFFFMTIVMLLVGVLVKLKAFWS